MWREYSDACTRFTRIAVFALRFFRQDYGKPLRHKGIITDSQVPPPLPPRATPTHAHTTTPLLMHARTAGRAQLTLYIAFDCSGDDFAHAVCEGAALSHVTLYVVAHVCVAGSTRKCSAILRSSKTTQQRSSAVSKRPSGLGRRLRTLTEHSHLLGGKSEYPTTTLRFPCRLFAACARRHADTRRRV